MATEETFNNEVSSVVTFKRLTTGKFTKAFKAIPYYRNLKKEGCQEKGEEILLNDRIQKIHKK
jgi:hypothetical protein